MLEDQKKEIEVLQGTLMQQQSGYYSLIALSDF